MKKDETHPRSHGMGGRAAKVYIYDDDGDHDGDHVENEGKEEIFSHERDCGRGWWEDFWDEQKEYNQCQKDAERQGDFFAGLTWQIENQHRKESHQDSWHYQDYCVEKSFPEIVFIWVMNERTDEF